MAPLQSLQHGANLLLLCAHFILLLWSRRRLVEDTQDILESIPARLTPSLIQRLANCGAIQPAFCMFSMGSGSVPPLEKDFHSQLFGTGLIEYDPANGAGNALIMSAKDCLKSLRVSPFRRACFGHALCVHIPRTSGTRRLWQGKLRYRCLSSMPVPVDDNRANRSCRAVCAAKRG